MKDRCHVQDWCHVQQGGHEQRRGHCGHGVRGGGWPQCSALLPSVEVIVSTWRGTSSPPPLFFPLSPLLSAPLSCSLAFIPSSLSPFFLFSFSSILFRSSTLLVSYFFVFLFQNCSTYRGTTVLISRLFVYLTVLRLFFLCSIHCFICAFSGFAFPIVIAVACKHHFYHSFNRLDKTQKVYFLLSTFIYQKSPFTSHSRRIVYLERKTFFMIFFTRSYKQV